MDGRLVWPPLAKIPVDDNQIVRAEVFHGRPLAVTSASEAGLQDHGERGAVLRGVLDQIGAPGGSVHDGKPLSGLGDLMAWLDGVFVHCGLDSAYLCGHSYGSWLALNYALHAPHRVRKLALLDPTRCFAGLSLNYLLRAAPMLARPTAKRVRAFFEWETGNAPIDSAWLDLITLGATEFPQSKIVMPRRPKPERLRASAVPALVLFAENSKSHHIRRVATNARRLMPHVVTAILPGVSHHSVPTVNPAELNRQLLEFFA